jgi:hypothetical protein
MKHIFDSIKKEVQQRILQVNDQSIFSDSYEERLFQEFKVSPPYLKKVKKEDSFIIGEERIEFENAPEGISITPGQTMEYALIVFKIGGPLDLFNEIMQKYYWDSKCYVRGGNIYYKEISPKKITGNDQVILAIKEKAKTKMEGIESQLNNFSQSALDFNDNDLKPFIAKAIEHERKRRNNQKDSESKLYPF